MTVLKAAASLKRQADGVSRKEVVEGNTIVLPSTDTRKICASRLRPARKNPGALTTAASCDTALDVGGAIGAWRPAPRPNNVLRSHVENGAVKGASTRTTSQHAVNRESMADGCGPVQQALRHQIRRGAAYFSRNFV
jgi:hypothetical protein